ncbi:MAG TPA: class I SAM-dependent methyltransferase [Chloroflexota bacterium]|nr:class I SAM-dependent methyltransferase [Chloroflexota bacterium]
MEPEQYALLAHVEHEHWWFRGQRRLVAALLDGRLPIHADGRVLDAGCGTGGTTAWLRRYGEVVGVDRAAEAAPFWPAAGLRRMARGSIAALPFRSESFTLVTCFDVLYHRQVLDEESALAEFSRVLRPDGLLLLRVPAYDWLQGGHDVAVHTRHRYTRGEVVAAVRAAGLSPEVATYGNCFLFPLALAKRVSERWRGPSQEEMAVPSPLLNAALLGVLGLEALVAPRRALPFGLSVVVLARKPARAAPPRPLAVSGAGRAP